MNASAPIGKIVKLAKDHPVATVAALGVVAVLAVLRARSGSSSGFDETGPGVDSGGVGGGGGSVPLETVPGAPSNLPSVPSSPSTVLSSPIMSVPPMPAIPGYGNSDSYSIQPAYSPLDFGSVQAAPTYIAPAPAPSFTQQHPALSNAAQQSISGLGQAAVSSGLGKSASQKPIIPAGLGAAASKPVTPIGAISGATSGLGAAASTPTITSVTHGLGAAAQTPEKAVVKKAVISASAGAKIV